MLIFDHKYIIVYSFYDYYKLQNSILTFVEFRN